MQFTRRQLWPPADQAVCSVGTPCGLPSSISGAGWCLAGDARVLRGRGEHELGRGAQGGPREAAAWGRCTAHRFACRRYGWLR